MPPIERPYIPSPFEFAEWIESGDFLRIKPLIEGCWLDIDIQVDENGATPLIVAAHCGNLELVRYFVEAGADINMLTTDYDFAYRCASEAGHIEISEYLRPLTNPEIVDPVDQELAEEDYE